MKFRNSSLLVLLMVVAACSGSDTTSPNDASLDSADVSVIDSADVADAAPAEPAQGQTNVAASVTIGDETWTFDAVSCTLGTEVDGVLYGPSVAGGFTADATMGMVVSSDADVGDRVTVTDISFDDATSRFDSTIDFTEVIFDGDEFSGTGEFVDKAADSADRIPGSFSGTCP